MGQVLHRGREPVGVAGLWGRRPLSTISWWRLGGLRKVTEGGFVEEVQGCWIRGEDAEAFSKDPFEVVESWIISSGEGKVMGVMGGAGGGVGVMENSG